MRRVLLLVKSLEPGGAQRLLADSVRHADRASFDYEVAYLLARRDGLVPELKAAGVPVHVLHGERGTGWLLRLRKLAESRAIDLLHAHSPYVAVGARLALRRRPLVYTEHNVWPAYYPLTRMVNWLTFSRNAHVFAVSDAVRQSIRRPPLRTLPPVETLYHGVAWPGANLPGAPPLWRELGLPHGAPVVASVASFRPEKGHAHLIDAAALVRRELPDVRFVLVGDGPTERDARRRVKRLGLETTVLFTGRRDDAAQLGGACDVFTLASLHEGLPLALLEAMAAGRPAVVTRAGGMPEVVRHGRDGLVVAPGQPAELAEALLALLGDRARRDRLGRAAADRVRDFDMARAVRRIEAVYSELLG